ncbi:hypothetical protein KG091_04410 [Carnobacteriaceae bacterium zg-ZUI78]|nr:hypothetical protein [Carnobacteriaceae bacterium zg-ZUI78]
MTWEQLALTMGAVGGLLKIVLEYRSATKETNHILSKVTEDMQTIKKDAFETKTITIENREGIRHSQRYRLQHDLHVALERGYTTVRELEELTVLFNSYKSLGGNGAIETMFEKFKALEIKGE